MFVNPWTFFLLSWTEIRLNSFETVSIRRNSSPFWVCDLQTPKATFTTRYVQTYFTFPFVPPNKWCPPQFTVAQLVIWSGKFLSCSTWQSGKTWKSRTKWSHENETESSFFFLFPHLCLQFRCTLVLRHAGSIHEQAAGQKKKKKKAFSFTTSYTRETPETHVGVQLFLVGLNFRSANTRGSTAYLLVMAILGCMNVSQAPRWPVEQRSTKILAQVSPIKTVNTSTGYCSVVLIHKLRPIITKSLGKPSILATSKHPSLL